MHTHDFCRCFISYVVYVNHRSCDWLIDWLTDSVITSCNIVMFQFWIPLFFVLYLIVEHGLFSRMGDSGWDWHFVRIDNEFMYTFTALCFGSEQLNIIGRILEWIIDINISLLPSVLKWLPSGYCMVTPRLMKRNYIQPWDRLWSCRRMRLWLRISVNFVQFSSTARTYHNHIGHPI